MDEIHLLLELAVLRFHADVVALAVAGVVVVLRDVDAAGEHADGERDVARGQVEARGAHAVGLQYQLRQVELQVGVHAADLRVGLQRALQLGGEAAHLLQVRPLDHELQRLRALALHQAEGAREGACARHLLQLAAGTS